MGPVVLSRRLDKVSNRCTEVRKVSAGILRGSGAVQEHREMLWDMYGSLDRTSDATSVGCLERSSEKEDQVHFEKLYNEGCGDAENESYGGAGSEVVRMDNLKTSDYPLVGWRMGDC
ncbi:hypothetical protein Acr_03g0004310 [Actinidia rufa]|uniref:Uncharacterized protein n=1 Tax=Actinidia rufa TaxID=165716 RepID=A0A7J0EDD2_9ERIC|nr:hypothetical protein Acr_03g0004310 [Actinidia rufa]